MKKKKIAICLALSLALLFSVSASAKSELPFSDVKESTWYYKELLELYNGNIINGFPDGTFKGTTQLKEDQLLKLLVTTVNPRGNYNTGGSWFEPYLQMCAQFDIVKFNYKEVKLEDGTIDHVGDESTLAATYNRDIKRSDVIKLVAKGYLCGHIFGVLEIESEIETEVNKLLSEKFKDYNQIPNDIKPSLYILYNAGIIQGNDDGNFNPNGYLTRAEATAIIYRVRNARKKLIGKGEINFEKLHNEGYVYSDMKMEETSTLDGPIQVTPNYNPADTEPTYTKEEVEKMFASREALCEKLGYAFYDISDEEMANLKAYYMTLVK